MKKFIFCSCLVAALLCCLILPSFAVSWFGSGVSGYRVVSSSSNFNPANLKSWLVAAGFTSTDTTITLPCTLNIGGTSTVVDCGVYCEDANHAVAAYYNGETMLISYIQPFDVVISGTAGKSEAEAVSAFTVSDVDDSGFVSDGFSNGLGIAGTVVNFCTSNTYVLIAIGLAVGVPLVGWGISKLKSLIKGY